MVAAAIDPFADFTVVEKIDLFLGEVECGLDERAQFYDLCYQAMYPVGKTAFE